MKIVEQYFFRHAYIDGAFEAIEQEAGKFNSRDEYDKWLNNEVEKIPPILFLKDLVKYIEDNFLDKKYFLLTNVLLDSYIETYGYKIKSKEEKKYLKDIIRWLIENYKNPDKLPLKELKIYLNKLDS